MRAKFKPNASSVSDITATSQTERLLCEVLNRSWQALNARRGVSFVLKKRGTTETGRPEAGGASNGVSAILGCDYQATGIVDLLWNHIELYGSSAWACPEGKDSFRRPSCR